MIPMKTQGVFDSGLVDDIFYKINEIYMHHATFLVFLERTLQDWDSTTCIGDIIYNTVSIILFFLIYTCNYLGDFLVLRRSPFKIV